MERSSAKKTSHLPALSSEQRTRLWARIARRLKEGEVLISNRQFQAAMEEEYRSLVGRKPSSTARKEMGFMVEVVNRDHPETYVTRGVQNGVKQAFESGVRKLNWSSARVQEKGTSSILRFSKMDEIIDLLEEAHIRPEQIDVVDCVRTMLREMERDHPTPAPAAPAASFAASFARKWLEVSSTAADAVAAAPAAPMDDPEIQAAITLGELDKDEVSQRTCQQEQKRAHLKEEETARAIEKHLPSYVERGVITAAQAEKLKALREVDEKLKRGEFDENRAAEIRNSILAGEARDKIESKIREVVDFAVRYLEAFESMQKIGTQYDQALSFLIAHKEQVVAETDSPLDMEPALQALMADVPLLEHLVDIMERKDQEIRMLSVRLPPYNQIAGRGLEKIGNMTIEEDFVDDLRRGDAELISARLHSPDKNMRVRPAADMRCLISLVDHVVKRTRFRKELRLLRIGLSIEEFYRSTSDLKEARHQAENFLKLRMRRLFPNMSSSETSEIRARAAEVIDAIEQKILDHRRVAVEKRRRKAEAARKKAQKAAAGREGGELELSEEEERQGVQIGRVEMRVAGAMRRIPSKIMADPEHPEQYILVHRDRETGELLPQMRRGARRIVERGRDGVWREER